MESNMYTYLITLILKILAIESNLIIEFNKEKKQSMLARSE